MAQVVEQLLSKCEALIQTPVLPHTPKKTPQILYKLFQKEIGKFPIRFIKVSITMIPRPDEMKMTDKYTCNVKLI
jgi:hypothetical protein